MSKPAILQSKLLSPPWAVPILVFGYFALCFFLHPLSPLHTTILFDPDDYMRLNETINWIQSAHPFGADWYNFTHPRFSPGDHTELQWSRLVDLPIAFFMLPLLSVMGLRDAALTASYIVPPLTFIVLLLVLPALTRPLTGKATAYVADLLPLFLPMALLNFKPGRVDHHGYQMLVAVTGILCLQRMVLCRGGWRVSIAAAFAFAAGLWIGSEALPWLMLFITGLAVTAAWRGGFVLRNAAVFGVALAIAVALAVPLAMPPKDYAFFTPLWFSTADLLFAVLSGLALVGAWRVGQKVPSAPMRTTLMVLFCMIGAALFAWMVPEFINPFRSYDHFNEGIAFADLGEEQPFWSTPAGSQTSLLSEVFLSLRFIFLPFVSLIVVGWNLVRARSKRRWMLWLIHALFLVPALSLTLFWQQRVCWFAEIFSIAPLTWLLGRAWSLCEGFRSVPVSLRRGAKVLVFMVLVPLPVLLLPFFVLQGRVYPDLALFPAVRSDNGYPLLLASLWLDMKYVDRPRLILSGVNEGPELLFRTNHNVLSAPFQAAGNKDAYDFLTAPDDARAREIALRRQIDLVLVSVDDLANYSGAEKREAPSGDATLAGRLASGKIPNWLLPIEMPYNEDYLLFEVVK